MTKTMVHFERCNVASTEMHNSRNEQYMACVNASPKKRYSIFADQTCNNSTWIHPAYAGMTLPQLLDRYRRLYRDKIRQAPQEKDSHRLVRNKKTGMFEEKITHGWAPIRESIVPVTADTTTSDFRHFIEWMARKGVRIIRIDIHQDEGHVDPLTGERHYNRHAHVIASWIDENTGKTAKLNKTDSSQMQDEIAASLGMERGVKKELTGAEHLTHNQYRARAQKILEKLQTDTDKELLTIEIDFNKKKIKILNDFTVRLLWSILKRLNPNQEELDALKKAATDGDKSLEKQFDKFINMAHHYKDSTTSSEQ